MTKIIELAYKNTKTVTNIIPFDEKLEETLGMLSINMEDVEKAHSKHLEIKYIYII